jgi:hypothetical protein
VVIAAGAVTKRENVAFPEKKKAAHGVLFVKKQTESAQDEGFFRLRRDAEGLCAL